ncbi:MAG: BlaI/MecI/CopY family transcriptional regulator [Spirochaetales bacterium]|nr:BlaI/MecI/CopY family transcriptional regulator [Spirochaetales bacterium]
MNAGELIFAFFASLPIGELTFSQIANLSLPFGVKETSLRTSLSRMHEKGLLQIEKRGRTAVYSFTEKSRSVSANVSAGFRLTAPDEWNGLFWGILFSLPAAEKVIRHKLRTKLEAYRYAPWMPGMWIRPVGDRERDGRDRERILYPEFCRVIEFRPEGGFSVEEAGRLWNLGDRASHMIRAASGLQDAMDSLSRFSAEEAFVQRMLRGDELVNALAADPLLPAGLLPPDWPAEHLKLLFGRWNRLIEPRAKEFYEDILRDSS